MNEKIEKLSIKKPSKSDFLIILSLLLYRIFLDLIYKNYIFPNYEYYHFKLNYDFSYMILSYFFLFLIIVFIPKLLHRKKLTDITLALLIIMYFIPYTSLLALCTHEIKYGIFVYAYFLLMIIFNDIIKIRKIKITVSKREIFSPKMFSVLIILCSLIIILISGIYTHFRISFDLSEYYEYRAVARENSIPEVLRYLFNWSIVGVEIGLAYCIINKKKILSLLVVIANLLAFSYNGKKSVLFILLIIIIISLFFKEKHIKKIPVAFLGLTMVGFFELLINNGNSFIAKHFIRRMLFIPPFMGTLYYDYFSINELDYLRASVLRRFGFVSPYGVIPRFIGQVYFNNVGIMAMNANTGLCGDAFSNFGFYSLIIAPFIIILTFKIIEACSKKIDRKIVIITAIWLAYAFVSGAYFTLLLTNGVIFLGMLLCALSSEKN